MIGFKGQQQSRNFFGKMNSLTKEILQEPRSAAVFKSFVETSIRDRVGTVEGKKNNLLRKGLDKQLVEEALPLGLLCDSYFESDPEVIVKHVLGNQNYDAEIIDHRKNPAPFNLLEITQAHEGEVENLRMEFLLNNGYSCATGKVQKSGTNRTGKQIKIDNGAADHRDLLNAKLCLIRQVFNKKIKKTYGNNTGLLIVFDDYMSISKKRRVDDIFALKEVLDKFVKEDNPFCWIGIIGWSGRTFVECKVDR